MFNNIVQAIKELATTGRLSEESQDFIDHVQRRVDVEFNEVREDVAEIVTNVQDAFSAQLDKWADGFNARIDDIQKRLSDAEHHLHHGERANQDEIVKRLAKVEERLSDVEDSGKQSQENKATTKGSPQKTGVKR